MDFQEHLGVAWRNTVKYIGPVLLLTLGQIVVSAVSFGILAPVTMAGYMQSLLLTLREGREPELKDLFSEMQLFLPLLLFGFGITIALALGFLLLVLPGILMTAALVFGSMYMVPLMSDRNMGLIDALKTSWKMATREPWTDQIILTVLYLIILSLGGTVVIAIFFAQPLATFLVLSAYEERLQPGKAMAPPKPAQPPQTPPVPPAPEPPRPESSAPQPPTAEPPTPPAA